jgi:DnaJ-class molecular chaperone
MTDRRSYYEILEVDPRASEHDIRSAFRRLARLRHPDRFQGPTRAAAERDFQAITEAYNVLSDSERRSRYDQTLGKSSQQLSSPREIARALLGKAVNLANAGDVAEANNCFAQAVAHDPDNPKAHHLYGVFLSKQVGGMEEGLRHLDQAARLAPADVKILIDASKAFARAKMLARATRFAQQAAQLVPDDPAITLWLQQLSTEGGGGGGQT